MRIINTLPLSHVQSPKSSWLTFPIDCKLPQIPLQYPNPIKDIKELTLSNHCLRCKYSQIPLFFHTLIGFYLLTMYFTRARLSLTFSVLEGQQYINCRFKNNPIPTTPLWSHVLWYLPWRWEISLCSSIGVRSWCVFSNIDTRRTKRQDGASGLGLDRVGIHLVVL